MIGIIIMCIAEALLFCPLCIHYFFTITLQKIKTKISVKNTIEKYGLPVIELYQNGKGFKFLVDTGATGNIVDSKLLNYVDHEKDDCIDSITGIDNQKIEVSTCYINLSYKNEYPDRIPFCVMDNMDLMNEHEDVYGIIGAPYLVALGIQIDYKNRIVWHK